jgi:hypothetical protein
MRNHLTDFKQWVREMVTVAPSPAASQHTLPVEPTTRPTDNRLPDGSIPVHQLPDTWNEMAAVEDQNDEDQKASTWARIMCGRGSAGQQVLDARLKERRRTSPEAMNRLRELGIRMD